MASAEELLLQITHCPVVERCKVGESLDCSRVVAEQPVPLADHQVPEPWSGNLSAAPIIFVSSNPSISDEEEYPRWSWPEDLRVDYFERRFAGGRKEWVLDGMRGLQRDGTHAAKDTYFWKCIVRRTSELLGRAARPGEDYVLTELVRCKSLSERGVAAAMAECVRRYLDATLAASGARLIVAVGAKARMTLCERMGAAPDFTVHGPTNYEGRERILTWIGHPSGPEPKRFSAVAGDVGVRTIRTFLASG